MTFRRVGKRIFLIELWAIIPVYILIWGIGASNAHESIKFSQNSPLSKKSESIHFKAPKVLPLADEALYRKIFRIQNDGLWQKANALIGKLQNKLLMGHVLAQRYLHPTKYRSRYKELRDWMAIYADHPDARRIYKLAIRRKPKNWRNPKPPKRYEYTRTSHKIEKRTILRRSLNRADRSKARGLKRQIRSALRQGHTLTAKKILKSKTAKRLFSSSEYDEASAKLAQVYFNDNLDEYALQWAGKAAKRSGHILPIAHWTAGLASWRLKLTQQSASHFEKAAVHSTGTNWFHAAASFWAARANLVGHRPEKVNAYLEMAAAKPRTFYGLLANHILGLPLPFKWTTQKLDDETISALIADPVGKRAMALLQVNQRRRASRELRNLTRNTNEALARGILTLADLAGMAELSVRLDAHLFPRGNGPYNTAYPIPPWKPVGDFKVDRALIYALIRQESRFNPMAKSWAGARGLMQLMPATARFVARVARVPYKNRRKLFQPEFNLMLGQRYIKILMHDPNIKADLFLMMAAWNGGPGNLSKWRRRINDMGDPLFFIESLPSRETRNFIEHTLANLWIYRHRLGQRQISLNAIAGGEWPVYIPIDKATDEQAAKYNGKYGKN